MFIIAIAVIFICNVFYLVKLYNSIKADVERDVMSALVNADIDDLWVKAEQADRNVKRSMNVAADSNSTSPKREAQASIGQTADGEFLTTTQHPDGRVVSETKTMTTDESFTNTMIKEIGRQFHSVMDAYIGFNPVLMDSIFTERLANKGIYPDFVAVEVVDSLGKVLSGNPKLPVSPDDYDVFTLCFNTSDNRCYRAYITPLVRHILSEMTGVIITIFLLMVAFSAAFWYLIHTVSHLRTIEEMKDDFINNMTHELKTPIAIAYSANDALLNYDTSNDPAKKEAYLKIAVKQLKRLGELVENILAMSMERRKTMALNSEVIHLAPFIEEIVAAQRMREEKGITIDTTVDVDATVIADKTHFANVINNLIDNAIKYSGENVKIDIKCDSGGIRVADNGIGIPQKSVPYLFNKFYRVPHGDRLDIRGYGIGLYYVKSICDKMDWSINVNSHVGEGSVFNIKFNCHDEK